MARHRTGRSNYVYNIIMLKIIIVIIITVISNKATLCHPKIIFSGYTYSGTYTIALGPPSSFSSSRFSFHGFTMNIKYEYS